VKSGAGTTVLATTTDNGSNGFTGSVRVSGGNLQIGNSTTSNSNAQRLGATSVQVDSGATLTFKNSSAIPGSAAITLAGTINTDTTGLASGGFHNVLGAISFNGGTLTTANGANATSFQSYALNGDVTVTGSTVSNITAGGSAGNGDGATSAGITAAGAGAACAGAVAAAVVAPDMPPLEKTQRARVLVTPRPPKNVRCGGGCECDQAPPKKGAGG
jgi:hypothetical protein